MLAEAKRRIAAEPNRYIDHVWGEHEVGGTSVLYVSGVDLSFLNWQGKGELGNEALPDLTWAALRKVPAEFIGMGTLMTGIWWIIDRRMRRQKAKAEESEPNDE